MVKWESRSAAARGNPPWALVTRGLCEMRGDTPWVAKCIVWRSLKIPLECHFLLYLAV